MTSQYPLGQLSAAFRTACEHEDAATRARADERAERWLQMISGMLSGRVHVGSRTPVADLPAWVTLEVLRGGFATGKASAGGLLEADERALAERVGIPANRPAIFGYYLTDTGIEELLVLLDSGGYRVDLPEDAALLMVAWLLRAGDRAAAFDVVDALAPLAHRLRFAPRVSDVPAGVPNHVHRITAGRARDALAGRRVPAQLERQREALTVWNPFTDRMLALWSRRYDAGTVDLDVDPGWRSDAVALLATYDVLAAAHQLCRKHRNPKQNLAIMVAAARDLLDDRLSPRRAGLLATAVTTMTAKRGEPQSARLATVRAEQDRIAAAPNHATLAAVAAARLAAADADAGVRDPSAYLHPVTAVEIDAPAGTPMPPVVARVLTRARSAPVEELLADGTVPSAEVLAELLPTITATVVAASFPDPAIARLAAAHYRAFRDRRSLLLTDLASQVRLTELPWFAAVARHARQPVDEALGSTRRVGALYLDWFPATIVPNPLVQELRQLLASAGEDVPLTEELAADIFEERFSPKFTAAAAQAGMLLADSIYADYYDIDYRRFAAEWTTRRPPARSRWWGDQPDPAGDEPFTAECKRRAASDEQHWSVAANGTVIEQAQILTTHNLVALVTAGVRPTRPWSELAAAALHAAAELLARAETQARPLAAVKDAAYALRQAIFHLSMVPRDEARFVVSAWSGPGSAAALPMIRGGLLHVVDGGRFDGAGRCPRGLRFLGWTTEAPWVLPVRAAGASG